MKNVITILVVKRTAQSFCVFLVILAAALFVCRGRPATTATSSAQERLFCIVLVKAMKGRGVAF